MLHLNVIPCHLWICHLVISRVSSYGTVEQRPHILPQTTSRLGCVSSDHNPVDLTGCKNVMNGKLTTHKSKKKKALYCRVRYCGYVLPAGGATCTNLCPFRLITLNQVDNNNNNTVGSSQTCHTRH